MYLSLIAHRLRSGSGLAQVWLRSGSGLALAWLQFRTRSVWHQLRVVLDLLFPVSCVLFPVTEFLKLT